MHEFDRLTELQLGSPQSGASLLEKLLGSLWQELPDRGGCPSRFAACVCVFLPAKERIALHWVCHDMWRQIVWILLGEDPNADHKRQKREVTESVPFIN